MTMYTHDNHDFLPPNPDDGNTIPGYNWCAGNVAGGMPPGAAGATGMTDPDLLKSASTCLISPYLGGEIAVFQCPADPRFGLYHGADAARSSSSP